VNKQPRINRRRFLKLAGGAVGAGALACGGLATLGLRHPAIEFAEPSCGEKENIGEGNWSPIWEDEIYEST
jgi:hypothetical protein